MIDAAKVLPPLLALLLAARPISAGELSGRAPVTQRAGGPAASIPALPAFPAFRAAELLRAGLGTAPALQPGAAAPSAAATAPGLDHERLAAFVLRAGAAAPTLPGASRAAVPLAALAAPGSPAAAADAEASRRAVESLQAADAVLREIPLEDLRRMPAEQLDGVGERILARLLGTKSRDEGSHGVAAPEAKPLEASLRPSAAPAPKAQPAVPAPAKAPLARRLAWPAAVLFVWTGWTFLMTAGHHWGLFAHNWFMSVTMALGSFVAGASSEGSGSVSFPVMTLLFHIKPAVARDFALMIQAVGMTTAALTILAAKIPVEKRAIVWGALGGFVGMALSLSFVAPLFAPPFAKMFFTSLWAAFALALYAMNKDRARRVFDRIAGFGARDAAALVSFGVIGGLVSGIVGTGLCMVTFTLLVLNYRVSEKVATPTSVVLMATNAAFGFLWKTLMIPGGMSPEAWGYWWVCVPIVVIGAPLGARFIKNRSRHFVAKFLYATIGIQLVAALLIVKQTPLLLATSAATFAIGTLAFRLMARRGRKRAADADARPATP